jgi:hypothetical protein
MEDQQYNAIAKDGSRFGPASLETLNFWAAEGRIVADTVIERISDGVRAPAKLLPGLVLPPPGPRAPTATPTPPVPDPTVPSTAGRPGNVQFKEPDFVPPPRPPSPIYGEVPQYTGYERESYSYGYLPVELQGKFNWGAFVLTWIWGLNHRAYVTLIFLALHITSAVINYSTRSLDWQRNAMTSGATDKPGGSPIAGILGLVCIGMAIWFGAKGYEWAWDSGRFRTPDECRRCQAIWGWWGLGVFLFGCVCVGGVVFLAVLGGAGRPGRF